MPLTAGIVTRGFGASPRLVTRGYGAGAVVPTLTLRAYYGYMPVRLLFTRIPAIRVAFSGGIDGPTYSGGLDKPTFSGGLDGPTFSGEID